MSTLPHFHTPELAKAVEALGREEIDALPFGVIGLDGNGQVRVYNKSEAQNADYREPISEGAVFFVDVAPSMNNGDFKGHLDRALRSGALDLSFEYVRAGETKDRRLKVRAQMASDDGCWIFIDRKDAA